MNLVKNQVISRLSSEPKAKQGRRQTPRKKWITLTYNGSQVKSVADQYGSQNVYATKEYNDKSNAGNEQSYDPVIPDMFLIKCKNGNAGWWVPIAIGMLSHLLVL